MRHFVEELEQLKTKLLEMSSLVEAAIQRSIAAVIHKDKSAAEEVFRNEARAEFLCAVMSFRGFYFGLAVWKDRIQKADTHLRQLLDQIADLSSRVAPSAVGGRGTNSGFAFCGASRGSPADTSVGYQMTVLRGRWAVRSQFMRLSSR